MHIIRTEMYDTWNMSVGLLCLPLPHSRSHDTDQPRGPPAEEVIKKIRQITQRKYIHLQV